MKIRLLALSAIVLLFPGCLVVRERPRCGPDQYWDGHECRFRHHGR